MGSVVVETMFYTSNPTKTDTDTETAAGKGAIIPDFEGNDIPYYSKSAGVAKVRAETTELDNLSVAWVLQV